MRRRLPTFGPGSHESPAGARGRGGEGKGHLAGGGADCLATQVPCAKPFSGVHGNTVVKDLKQHQLFVML